MDTSMLTYIKTVVFGTNRKSLYRCVCGNEKVIFNSSVNRGRTVSCGCWQKRDVRTHGETGSREYVAYHNMINRCTRESCASFHRYGGRGISVCDRWMESFDNFFEDMGRRPSDDHSVDRINNDGNYEPSNCRWATDGEQANNKAKTIRLSAHGVTLSVGDWAKTMEVPYSRIIQRHSTGMSDYDSIFTPKQNRWSKK